MIRVGLIGAGAMGRLHARTVRAHPQFELVSVADRHPERAALLVEAFGGRVASPRAVDLVIVATPASTHVAVASPYVGRVPLLIEKPLAPTARQASPLVHPAVFVGMSERFSLRFPDSPGSANRIRAVRTSVASERGRDVDVVSDLLVHDIDRLIMWDIPCTVLQASGKTGLAGLDSVTTRIRTPLGHADLKVSRVAETSSRSLAFDGRVAEPASGPDALTVQLTSLAMGLQGDVTRCATSAEAYRGLELCDEVRRLARGLPHHSSV